MSDNAYHFVDRWRVEGDIKEVADILEDALSLPRWWGSVYFAVKEIEAGEKHGIGKLISLRRGRLVALHFAHQLSHGRGELSARLYDGRDW